MFDFYNFSAENDKKVYGDLDIAISNDIRFTIFNDHTAKKVVDGAPVDESPVTTLFNPKAKTDATFYAETKSTLNPEYHCYSKEKLIEMGILYPNVPSRLTFLTPGGKRLIDADAKELRDSKGGLKSVHMMLENLIQFLKLAKSVESNNGKRYPPSHNIPTSEYVLKKLGIDRSQAPVIPLNIPQFILDDAKRKEDEIKASIVAKNLADNGDGILPPMM